VAHLRAVRSIAAEPTSTALLLAGRTAVELWPGVRRAGEVDGRVLVEATLAAVGGMASADVLVRVLPPHRTPVSFVTRFGWESDGLPAVEGTLTLLYGEPHTTRAVLELTRTGPGSGELEGSGVEGMAVEFLDNLAAAAEARAFAA